jgi:hypothetical protein
MPALAFEFHPASEPFPLLEGAEYQALLDSIAKHGQVVPIILLDGKILDGRNRYRVCMELGIEPVTVNFTLDGSTAADVAEALNLVRRHLDAKARATIAAKLREKGMSERAIAENLEVSKTTIHKALSGGHQKTTSGLRKRGTTAEFLEEIETFYNYGAKGNRIPLTFMARRAARDRRPCQPKSAAN